LFGSAPGDTDFRKLEVPDNAVRIEDPSEAPEGASIVRGDRGGTYYIPEGEGNGETDETDDVTADPDDISEFEQTAVTEGDEVIIEGPDGEEHQVTVQVVGSDNAFVVEDTQGNREVVEPNGETRNGKFEAVGMVGNNDSNIEPSPTRNDDGDIIATGETTTGEDVTEYLAGSNVSNVGAAGEDLGGVMSSDVFSVGEASDGRPVYIKDIDDEDRMAQSQNATSAAFVLQEMGLNAPAHFLDEDTGQLKMESAGGVSTPEDSRTERIETEDLANAAAGRLLVGDIDIHAGNFVVDEDGSVSNIDLDMSGSKLDDSIFEGPGAPNKEIALKQFDGVDEKLDTPVNNEDLESALDNIVEELEDESGELPQQIQNSVIGDAVKNNVEMFKAGELL
jgi:hypothetical protein